MENNETEIFTFTYSVREQEEIRNIRKKYVVPEEDKIEQLIKLDASVTQKATITALISGIIGMVMLGVGMSLVMSDLSEMSGFYRDMGMMIGIIIGVVGIVLLTCAYPVYNWKMKKEREKIAPEIIRLTDELMK